MKPRHHPVDPSLAVAYLRVSTTDQHLGPEAQRAAIDAWALRSKVTVVAWHTDQGVSGGSEIEDRPGLISALASLKEERAGILLLARRDRLARDPFIATTIERRVAKMGARVNCADGIGNGDSATDGFMKHIIDAAAAYERELIRGRTRNALAVKKARGERIGAVPYGYSLADDGKRLVPNDHEQATINELRRLRGEGYSYRRLRSEGAAMGLLSRTQRPFTLQALFNMVGMVESGIERSAAE